MKHQKFLVDSHHEGQRIDKWVHHRWPSIPFSAIQKALRTKDIALNNKKVSASHHVVAGEEVSVYEGWLARMSELSKPSGSLCQYWHARVASWVMHTYPDFWIVHKPAGLACQGGTGQTTSLDVLLERWAQQPVYLVHRLDQWVSGVMVVARHPEGAARLSQLTQERQIQKRYWALVRGRPSLLHGHIRAPIGYLQGKAVVNTGLKSEVESHTEYMCRHKGKFPHPWSWLELTLHTGRKHQLRAHLSHLGHPILGDSQYGTFAKGMPSLKLHSYQLSFLYHDQLIQHTCTPPTNFFEPYCSPEERLRLMGGLLL